jgi:acyl carrier protein
MSATAVGQSGVRNAAPEAAGSAVIDRVRRLVATQMDLDVSQVRPSSSLRDDLGMDSLDVVEFQMQVEDSFALNLPDELEASTLATVQDVADLIVRLSPGQ